MSGDDLGGAIARALAPLGVVRVAYLFGSHATGRARPDSDLDIAVAYSSGLDDRARESARREVVGALTDALGALGERADVVDFDRTGSAVAFNAIRARRCVMARSERDRVNLEVRIARRYDDEAPRRVLYRRAAVAAVRRMGGGP